MRYAEHEAGQIRQMILDEQHQGNNIRVIPDGADAVLSKVEFSFFNNAYEAAEFCYENGTDLDRFIAVSTGHVLQDIAYQLRQQNELNNSNDKIMDQKNIDYLTKQVKFTGFGETLENDIKANIEKQEPTFQLTYPHDFGKDETVSTLNFRKADNNEMYFFNNYNLSVKHFGEKEPVAQTFYVGRDNTFTLKEGYNLLSGRSVNKALVNKEKEEYNAWVKLDFKDTDANGNYKLKHYTENYGYNMPEELGKLPIKELANDESKASLIESLQKGNRQSVTFLTEGGSEEKRFIEANAQYKSITQYDSSMKRIMPSQKESESQGESTGQAKKAKQAQKDDGEDAPKKQQKQTKKRGHKVS